MSNLPQQPYRIPQVLRDLQLVDVLELTGSTTASAAQIGLSQASVSRRYRALARELGLQRLAAASMGKRYGDTPWLQLLRRGINSHRLAWGVLRLGGSDQDATLWQGQHGVEWVTLGRRQQQHWQPLLQLRRKCLPEFLLRVSADEHTQRLPRSSPVRHHRSATGPARQE